MNPFLQHAERIIKSYEHASPLHLYLKKYYKKYPVLGSRDRKYISQLVYAWFRFSKGMPTIESFVDKLLYSCLLAKSEEKMLLKCFGLSLEQQQQELQIAQEKFAAQLDFLPQPALSSNLAWEDWLKYLQEKPRVFIWIFPEYKEQVSQALLQHTIPHEWVGVHTISFDGSTNVAQVFEDAWYVVQDFSSQKTYNVFEKFLGDSVWECCAGAGGKSLMIAKHHHALSHTVSDIRPQILHNLNKRFKLYSLPQPHTLTLDLLDEAKLGKVLGAQSFQTIVADVPCTGSGTWARTPEDAFYFKAENLPVFSEKQHRILNALDNFLATEGHLVYITCSVFKEENEGVINEFIEKRNYQLVHQELITGMAEKADCMYVAILQKLG